MEILQFEEIDSTHKYLIENYKTLKNKTIVLADMQTAGIGTRGRSWYTGNKNNIAISILYKENLKLEELEGLTIKIADKIKKTIKKLYNIDLKIKEPNDLMLNNKKICGILTQVNTLNGKINYLIISIGFNVNEIEFSDEIKDIATSLKKEFGIDFNKKDIIEKIILELKDII